MLRALLHHNTSPQEVEASTQTGESLNRIRCMEVAVVGASAAGLVAARELLCDRDDHVMTIFLQSSRAKGTWAYDLLGYSSQWRMTLIPAKFKKNSLQA